MANIPRSTMPGGTWITIPITWVQVPNVSAPQIDLDLGLDLDLAVPVEKKKVSSGCTCKNAENSTRMRSRTKKMVQWFAMAVE